jgi:3-dehydroquinate synthase
MTDVRPAAAHATLRVDLGERSYPIHVGPGLLGRADLLHAHLARGRAFVVTDETVAPLYLDALRGTLGERAAGSAILPDGERHKTLAQASALFDRLVADGCGRDTTLIALGGGVVGDLGGFAAACYQRGIPWIQVPTTLLAQADASVGGKTAVNHPAGKNLIGAFHQPRLVLCDTATLRTLDARQFRAGLAEVIKHALLGDADFFAWLEAKLPAVLERDPAVLAHAVERSCALKARIVAQDEREESGQRALLNLGHTFGHAIEAATGFEQWLHGEAVAAGIVLAARLSRRMGMLDTPGVERIIALLSRSGLPVEPPPMTTQRFLELMRLDKKVREGRLSLVLIEGIGKARATADFAREDLVAMLDAATAPARR